MIFIIVSRQKEALFDSSAFSKLKSQFSRSTPYSTAKPGIQLMATGFVDLFKLQNGNPNIRLNFVTSAVVPELNDIYAERDRNCSAADLVLYPITAELIENVLLFKKCDTAP